MVSVRDLEAKRIAPQPSKGAFKKKKYPPEVFPFVELPGSWRTESKVIAGSWQETVAGPGFAPLRQSCIALGRTVLGMNLTSSWSCSNGCFCV